TARAIACLPPSTIPRSSTRSARRSTVWATPSRSRPRRPPPRPRQLRVAIARHEVVVDQTHRLREGVGDGRPAEGEAARLELLGELAAHLRLGRHVRDSAERVLHGLAVDELPDEAREAAGLALHQLEPGARIADRALDLAAVPHDARIDQQPRD